MYKYIGDFKHLEELGFKTDKYNYYYFLPTHTSNKYESPLTVDIKTRIIEYSLDEQLEILNGLVEKIV